MDKMENVLKKSVTRKQFLKAGLIGALTGILIGSNLNRLKEGKKDNSYGNSVYGGKKW